MADDIDVEVGAEAQEASARPRPDDDGLKNAVAALLGLGPQAAADAGASAVRLPPPRRPELPPDGPSVGRSAGPLSPDPAIDVFWSSPSRGSPPADGPLQDAPPPILDLPEPLLDAPEPLVDAPAPRLDAPAPLVDAVDADLLVDAPAPQLDPPPALVDPTPGPTLEDRDLWGPTDSSADDFWASPDPVPPSDLDDREAAPSSLAAAAWTGTAAGDRPASPATDGSPDTALQEAGLAGPLNTAMGDLRRLYPPEEERDAVPAVLRPTGVPAPGPPSRPRRSPVQAWWASRGRELVPGLAVAFVVVLAFAVVLIGRGGDDEGSRIDTKSSTTLPSAGAPTSVPGPSDQSIVVPPPEELPPAELDGETPDVGSAPVLVSPPTSAQSRPRSSGPRATPSPAPAPRPAPTAAPTTQPSSPATTQAPATTTPQTTQVPDPADPCDKLFSPEARQRCLDSRARDEEN